MRLLTVTALLFLAAAAPRLTQADQLDTILANKKMICGVQVSTPPFCFPDPQTRQQVGHDVDLCHAIADKLGVEVAIKPVSTEAKAPEIKLGHVDIGIMNLAYTRSRGEQIQFSNPYYITREMLVVLAENGNKTLKDFKGKRIGSSKGSTSELATRLQNAIPVTFQDAGSAYLATIQRKTIGFVNNEMTAKQFISKAGESGIKLAMIPEPMALKQVSVGMRHGEPKLYEKINSILSELENEGKLNGIWNKWIGPGTIYDIPRKDKVQSMSDINFEPLP
ncbi:MAG: transporter substrate-binding domain-containing protein [Sodalis sp. (in: enterobacteria)]|uniref:transporter substrate-binding domain-containing protein n=1 Tax=Sodalis sp. (in: enterobacteria) TaxID=1898979 RepID=UPI0039E2B622